MHLRRRSFAALLAFALGLLAMGWPLIASAQVTDLGQIDFPTSATSDEAQARFIEGTLLLHSFEYEDAAEAFRAAQALEPDFAMAYWGEAMTYNRPIWYQSFPDEAQAVLTRLAPTVEARRAKAPTEREQTYLAAVETLFDTSVGDHLARNRAYAAQMADLAERYPDDLEAQAFYALAILGTSDRNRETPVYMRGAAVAEEVYEVNPNHPGALHYLIHAYDDPIHAPLGLRAARRYADVAPAASHALHMPSHIFVALGMWDDVVAMNEASAAAAEARMERKGLDLNARGYHALWWLLYGYAQQGRYAEARALLADMEADYQNRPAGTWRIPYHLVNMRAAYLIDTERWTDDVAVAIDTSGMSLELAAVYQLANGLQAYHQGDREALEAAYDALHARRVAALPEIPAADVPLDPSLRAAAIMEQELDALRLYADGQTEAALARLAEAADAEAAMSFMFGPPRIAKPSHELLGELLLDQGRYAEAQLAFADALDRAPRRTRALLGLARAAYAAGDRATAQEAYAELATSLAPADADVDLLSEVQAQAVMPEK